MPILTVVGTRFELSIREGLDFRAAHTHFTREYRSFVEHGKCFSDDNVWTTSMGAYRVHYQPHADAKT